MHVLFRGSTAQKLRLASGLILFTYVLFHFINHALGLIGVEAMHQFQEVRQAITRSTVGGVLLYSALLYHVFHALYLVARRTTWRMPPWEAVQVATGLFIPWYLFTHISFTRGANTAFDVNDLYAYELLLLWPYNATAFSILLIVVWVHGCIGLHYWLRMVAWYRRWQAVLLGAAAALPVLSLTGFMAAGREMQTYLADPDIRADILETVNWPNQESQATLEQWGQWATWGFYVLLAAVLVWFIGRYLYEKAQHRYVIDYDEGVSVKAPIGPTLLEISRMQNIPHAAVCGGRARCSTCRVRIHAGSEALDPPEGAELKTLQSVKAPPDVRLACQIRPRSALTVTRIVQPMQADGRQPARHSEQGVERDMVVLFLDVRGFTRISDNKLPYDVVHILNQFFDAAGEAIREEDGWIDKYLGDGLMAVFGRKAGAKTGSAQALRAAHRIDLALETLNARIQDEVGEPIRIGIGIHAGPVVLGRLGYSDTAAMTVIGRTVNAASRLESLSKDLSCQLVFSAEVARLAGHDIGCAHPDKVQVRGLADPLPVYWVSAARELNAI
ncbi:adenylate/guanylate cyclase domain-containing protein [Shimia biformata]|uniref:adenylate/guanylate cyclase domain-containing protein n=1 Tax=Shimia biformata TaxID=1294299 RepID=UPI00194DDCC0|nr:adenylate/guanylate cyclase domain-containing protein [Shimia biformata]